MDKTQFRKITSRILRHSGFSVKMNKTTHEYELFDDGSPTPTLFCKPLTITEAEAKEDYLCFRVLTSLDEKQEKLYNRMINRFTRLAPSINISFEDESKPIFNEEQIEKLYDLLTEYDTEGEPTEE